MNFKDLDDATILKELKQRSKLFNELDRRHKGSLLVDLEINVILKYIGIERVKKWLKEVESNKK